MSMRTVNQNNVLAGSFVIVGVLLAVAFSFILGDIAGKFGSKKSLVVRFPTTVGVLGLEAGSEVTFAGLSVGEVVSVAMHSEVDEASGVMAPVAMDVLIEVAADLVLFEDAVADLAPPILGGISRINIASAGTGSVAADEAHAAWSPDAGGVLDENEMISGRFAPSILTQMGLGAEEARKIKDVIGRFPEWSDTVTQTAENAKEVSASVRRMTLELEPNFKEGVDDGRTTMANIRVFTDRLTAEGGWSDKIDSTISSVDGVATKIEPAIEEAREVMASIKGTVDENRENVSQISANIKDITDRVKNETIDKANTLLDDGALAVGSFNETLDEVQGIVVENRPRVSATMVNAQQLSLDAKVFVEELRWQPWRLMNKPSKSELKKEPLYEATRMYARSVADLHSASQSLDTAVRLAGGQGSDPKIAGDELKLELQRLATTVDAAYKRYEEAERGLLRLLAESP